MAVAVPSNPRLLPPKEGFSVLANVSGFLPYLYIAAPRGFTAEDSEGFAGYLNASFGNNGKSIVSAIDIHNRRSLWGYRGDEISPFIKITFVDQRSMTRVRGCFERGEIHFRDFFDDAIQTYESNISYDLRFMIDKKVCVCMLQVYTSNHPQRSSECPG